MVEKLVFRQLVQPAVGDRSRNFCSIVTQTTTETHRPITLPLQSYLSCFSCRVSVPQLLTILQVTNASYILKWRVKRDSFDSAITEPWAPVETFQEGDSFSSHPILCITLQLQSYNLILNLITFVQTVASNMCSKKL